MGNETWCILTSVGCLGNCSYCAIKFSKGKLKSRPFADILQEARQGVNAGYKWLSLIADDNGVYGRDIGTNLAALLKEVSEIEGDFNILIDSLSPNHLIETFDDLMAVFQKGKIRRICLTVQHVSPRILSSMNRYYDVYVLKQRLATLTTALPDLILDSHFIVGYPNETEEEFDQLISFARWLFELSPKNTFKQFAFSANPGTAAAQLEWQLSSRLIGKRMRKLNRLQRAHRRKMSRQRVRQMPRSLGQRLACAGLAYVEAISLIVGNLLAKIEWKLSR